MSKSEARNHAWQGFYDYESMLLRWFDEQANTIYDVDGEPLSYLSYELPSGGEITRPPRYIRKLVQPYNDELWDEAQQRYLELKDHYQRAMAFERASHDERYPPRFPIFLDGTVERINYSVVDAVKSVRVDTTGNVLVYSGFGDKDELEAAQEKADELRSIFQKVSVEYEPKTGIIDLLVDAEELHTYADATHIQRRHKTGQAYRARLTHSDGTNKSMAFGFFVVHPEQSVSVYKSLPRKKRTDTLPESSIINLPINTQFTFYRKA